MQKDTNVSAVHVNWHFTASVVNLVIINAYLSYLRQSFINNAYSKMESLYLIAHPSKNVNALELCWCSPFSIVKIYFHHRLHFFFFLLHSSEHRSVFKRKVSSQMTFHFLCYFCHMVGFCQTTCQPRHSSGSSWCGRSFQYHSSPTFALCERFCTGYWHPIPPSVNSLKPCLFKRHRSRCA